MAAWMNSGEIVIGAPLTWAHSFHFLIANIKMLNYICGRRIDRSHIAKYQTHIGIRTPYESGLGLIEINKEIGIVLFKMSLKHQIKVTYGNAFPMPAVWWPNSDANQVTAK